MCQTASKMIASQPVPRLFLKVKWDGKCGKVSWLRKTLSNTRQHHELAQLIPTEVAHISFGRKDWNGGRRAAEVLSSIRHLLNSYYPPQVMRTHYSAVAGSGPDVSPSAREFCVDPASMSRLIVSLILTK